MRILPTKFSQMNREGNSRPALIVKLQSNVNYVEQTYQADWAACWSYSNIDWTPGPPLAGDFMLSVSSASPASQLTWTNSSAGTTWGSIYGTTDVNQAYAIQSFVFSTGYFIEKIIVRVKETNNWGDSILRCTLYQSDKTTELYSSDTAVPSNHDGELTFTMPSSIMIETGQYWFKVSAANVFAANPHINWTSSGGQYLDGQFDYFRTDYGWMTLGDLYFKIQGYQYQTSGQLTTKTMSLSSIPSENGEWVFNDIIPSGTSLTYYAWGTNSSGMTFPDSWTSIGTIYDGMTISTLRMFYRVRANLGANSGRDLSPIVSAIRADFSNYDTYSNRPGLGYPAYIIDVSNLSMSIDLFNGSTIGEIDINMAASPQILSWITVSKPKNKTVKVLAGYAADGFEITDFIDYRWGQVDDYFLEDNVVTIKVKDFSKEWDAEIPKKWSSTADDITWSGSHHCDIIKDVLLNKIGIRDSKLELGSLTTVKDQTSGWAVTRKITGETLNAADIIDELRMLLAGFFIHTPTGAIKIKRFDASEPPIITLDDTMFISKRWEANANELYNRCIAYFNWIGSGDNLNCYSSFLESVNSDSQVQYYQTTTYELKDKWTTTAKSAQIGDLQSKIITRYSDPAPSIFMAELDRKFIALEVGDMVNISTACSPNSDGIGSSTVKYQVTKTEFNFMADRINVEFKRT